MSNRLTAKHIELLVKHGVDLDPVWIIEDVLPQDPSQFRTALLDHLDGIPEYTFRTTCTIQLGTLPGATPDPLQKSQEPPILPVARRLAAADPLVLLNTIRGTDLVGFSCYGPTAEKAKERADRVLAELDQAQQEILAPWEAELRKTGTSEQELKLLKKQNWHLWILHREPVMPEAEVTWE